MFENSNIHQAYIKHSSRRRRSRLINIRDVYDHTDTEFMYYG